MRGRVYKVKNFGTIHTSILPITLYLVGSAMQGSISLSSMF